MAVNAETFRAVRISDRVWWVGAIDWAVRDFHGYATDRGTTYNAYLVRGEKTILIDTVKAPFRDELLGRIASLVPPGSIDYIISNHAEMDHSGCLREVIDVVKPEKVFASRLGVKALDDHFGIGRGIEAVADGGTVRLGDVTLGFIETRMLHWPDSMFTHLQDENLLFSQDAFGMHLASSERFDDELPPALLRAEAEKYYANILLPFSPFVTRLLEKAREIGLSPQIIAPDHGPVWRGDPAGITALYGKWAAQKPTAKAVVVYDTMWGSTSRMASAIAEGITAGGASVTLMPLGSSHRSDVATEVLEAGALVVGTPTLNNNIFPTVADVMAYLKGLKPKNLIGAAFGSYGWSGEGVKQVGEMLGGMKVEILGEPLQARYAPSADLLARCVSLGKLIAEKLKERCESE